jgi:hypothetical protein
MFYYLLDTAICNAYLLSEHHRKSLSSKYVRGTHRAFREALVQELLQQYKIEPMRKYNTRRTLPPCRLDCPKTLHEKELATSFGRCYFCRFKKNLLAKSLRVIEEIGYNENVRQCRAMCKHCQVYLCSKCFPLFHSFEFKQ